MDTPQSKWSIRVVPSQMAALAGVHKNTVRQDIKRGVLPAEVVEEETISPETGEQRMIRRYQIDPDVALRYMEQRKVPPALIDRARAALVARQAQEEADARERVAGIERAIDRIAGGRRELRLLEE